MSPLDAKDGQLFELHSAPVGALLSQMGLDRGALDGQVALVTGGARGIGRQAALGLAALGARVAIVDKRSQGQETAALIRGAGGQSLFVEGNICLPGVLDQVHHATTRTWGPVDVLLNNAVEFQVRSVTETTLEDWDYTLGTNLRASLVGIQAVLPGMLERRRGVVVNMVAPGGIAYAADMSASKAALRSLVVSLAAELGVDSGVSVLGFLPPLVATELVAEVFPRYAERLGVTFHDYVRETRPNPGYPGLMPVPHCAAGLVHAIVHGQDHHGLVVDPFLPLRDAGLVPELDRVPPRLDLGTANLTRLRDEVRSVRALNEGLDRQVQQKDRALRRMAAVVETTTDAIITTDLAGLVVSCNPAAEALFGYTSAELIGQHISIMSTGPTSPEQQRLFATLLSGGRLPPVDTERRHKDGSLIPVSMLLSSLRDEGGRIVGTSGIIRDIRDRKLAEAELQATQEQLHHADRLAAMGRLAGGIAHDFNNMLTVILGCVDSVLDELGPDHPSAEELQDAQTAAMSTRSLTRQLLTFSRRQPARPEVLCLGQVLRDLQRLLGRTLGEDVFIALEGTQTPHPIEMDRSQLEQVLLNLAVNAREAMPTGGRLTFRLSEFTAPQASSGGLPAGPTVQLDVQDDGVGMDAETADRVFEPFFTTRSAQKGSGMGLALVYGIVHGHDGEIGLVSEPGRGTTFTLRLPRSKRSPSSQPVPARPRDRTTAAAGVLVVEDDPLVRRTACRLLRRRGLTVLDAPDGEQALALLTQRADEISVVLTDVVMPGMSGPEFAERIAAEHPHVRVHFMSGHADDHRLRAQVTQGAQVLEKPFNEQGLLDLITRALGSG